MKKYEIYIGLRDQDSYEEVITTDQFAKILVDKCKDKEIGFSMVTQLGGYTHNKGYTTETSLKITLFGLGEDDVLALGKALKKTVNTDTILVTDEECEYKFI